MFNFFRRRNDRGPGGAGGAGRPGGAGRSGGTVTPEVLDHLRAWAAARTGVEGFVEPETLVNEMSVVFVDGQGEWTRRPIGGPRGIDDVASATGVPLYFAEETGYPQRMRDRMERDRIVRRRLEQMERRERLRDLREDGGTGAGD
ncbi:oxidoreductase [Corynebacterium bovis]|uniref:oxidoreductase n=1 Tax=Corynebacterium bovis TaxID=36808 RepID=UPI00254D7A81|nr:oxidoreductase [Corynebacterium bovis]MDK8510202.1 oxidoreductase [Corynebacterium bovis]